MTVYWKDSPVSSLLESLNYVFLRDRIQLPLLIIKIIWDLTFSSSWACKACICINSVSLSLFNAPLLFFSLVFTVFVFSEPVGRWPPGPRSLILTTRSRCPRMGDWDRAEFRADLWFSFLCTTVAGWSLKIEQAVQIQYFFIY